MVYSFWLFTLALSLDTTEISLAKFSSLFPIRYLYTLIRCLLGLLFSRLLKPRTCILKFQLLITSNYLEKSAGAETALKKKTQPNKKPLQGEIQG